MPWMELFETVDGFSILDYYRQELRPPDLKINVETIYSFKLIFNFVYESYLLLNLRQIIYVFSLKYFKSYFVKY